MGRGLLISRNVGRAAAPALTLADTRSPALPFIGPQTTPWCPLRENNPPWWTWGNVPAQILKTIKIPAGLSTPVCVQVRPGGASWFLTEWGPLVGGGEVDSESFVDPGGLGGGGRADKAGPSAPQECNQVERSQHFSLELLELLEPPAGGSWSSRSLIWALAGLQDWARSD